MAQFTGKFKAWKVEEKNGFTKIDLGDSKKNKDGTYNNFTWYNCTLFGDAKGVQVNEGDTVEVKSGVITQRKYEDKWYNDIAIFDLEVTKKGEAKAKEPVGFVAVDNDFTPDDCPF